ncbi:MAG TPA: hypothetical protein ACQGQX_08870, partial [Xylella taiwanensis]
MRLALTQMQQRVSQTGQTTIYLAAKRDDTVQMKLQRAMKYEIRHIARHGVIETADSRIQPGSPVYSIATIGE